MEHPETSRNQLKSPETTRKHTLLQQNHPNPPTIFKNFAEISQ